MISTLEDTSVVVVVVRDKLDLTNSSYGVDVLSSSTPKDTIWHSITWSFHGGSHIFEEDAAQRDGAWEGGLLTGGFLDHSPEVVHFVLARFLEVLVAPEVFVFEIGI